MVELSPNLAYRYLWCSDIDIYLIFYVTHLFLFLSLKYGHYNNLFITGKAQLNLKICVFFFLHFPSKLEIGLNVKTMLS